MHNISKSTYLLLNLYSVTIPTPPYHASAHTAEEPLFTTTTQDSDLQTHSEFLIPKPYYFSKLRLKLASTLKASLYLYIPTVQKPWVGRHILFKLE